jgi:hypothetical protein
VLWDAVGTAVKCLNAVGQVGLEVYAVAASAASLVAFLFGGEFVPAGNVVLLASAAYNGYVAVNNFDYVKESVLYCTGDRANAPSAGSANGPDFPLPPIPPLGPSRVLVPLP